MGLAYLRSDADRAMDVGMGRVLLRETAGCGRDMALALRTAQGTSKMTAPYWMGRRFLGAASRPLADDIPISFNFLTPRQAARVRIRRNQSDLLILWQVFLKRFYELGVHYRLDRDIDTLDTIVDLGGNTGLAASYFTARYRPRTLLTVEPIPQNLAVLRHNATLSGLDWKIEPAAVAGESGTSCRATSASVIRTLIQPPRAAPLELGIQGLGTQRQAVVARMREAYVHGDPATQAVVTGFRHSARVVVAAAVIMIAVFSGFVGAAEPMIKTIGFGLAVAVLFDAFVVRMALVPAVLALLGDRAWWLPKWLDRLLPRVDIEGTGLTQTRTQATDPTRGEHPRPHDPVRI